MEEPSEMYTQRGVLNMSEIKTGNYLGRPNYILTNSSVSARINRKRSNKSPAECESFKMYKNNVEFMYLSS